MNPAIELARERVYDLEKVRARAERREHFAGLAMQGLVIRDTGYDEASVADASIAFADALIAALGKDT